MKHDLILIKDLLEEKALFYNRTEFIASDPLFLLKHTRTNVTR